MQRRFRTQYFHLLHSFWHYAGGKRWQIIFFYTLTLIANLALLLQPYVIGKVVNTLQLGGNDMLHTALLWLWAYVGLAAAFWIFHGPSRVIERNIAYRAKCRFLEYYYHLLTHLPMQWHQNHHSGSTANRVNKASRGLYDFSDGQYIYAESIVRFVGAFIVLAFMSAQIAIAEILFATVIILILMRFDRVIIRLIDERNEGEHDYAAAFFDYLGNIASITSFNLREHSKQMLNKILQVIAIPVGREITVNEVKWCCLMMLLVTAELVIMYLYMRSALASNDTLMLGSLVALFQYLHTLNSVFFGFAAHYQRLVQQHTDLTAIEPLDEAYASMGIEDSDKPVLQISRGAIRFDHIRFAYAGGREVFDALNLSIAPGEKIGLVGHSGAGKTTLVNLLLRYYETSENTISIDGQNIRDVTYASLRRSIGVIPQDTALFEMSLMENIRCGRLGASDEEVIEAARKAHAHEFIRLMPEGYGAMVGERGVKLSGGQRQRIAIARAILKNAPILILDEATSALDSESEKFIQESLVELMEGKTVIAIAHRLSTIAHLDRLVVLEEGRIIEEGSHAELLAHGGHYARLWALQSGGFLPD